MTYIDTDIRYDGQRRDQDDEPMQELEGPQYDEYGHPESSQALSLQQQKAELKRKIMMQPPKKQKVKKQKKDTVYNPDSKLQSLG